jgi:alcohol dehydrogenase class IV
MNYKENALRLLREFKGDSYLFGRNVLPKIGDEAAKFGKKALFVRDHFPGSDTFLDEIRASLSDVGIKIAAEEEGAGPNAPREDLYRITEAVKKNSPDIIVSFGGGSTIDASKSAEVLRTLGGDIEDYFGTGMVSQALADSGKQLTHHVAIQTAASSGAHLTKYSNITDIHTGQKKLIVDEAVVPGTPVFDYRVTYGAPKSLTMDGALDGIAHCLEVLYGAVGKDSYGKIREVARSGIGLVVENLQQAIDNPKDQDARDTLCLATDMGAYSIMLGGTNGGHLTSFSLVDLLSHGRACALMNPYYTVFFAPAIEDTLRMVGSIYKQAGFTDADLDKLKGRDLGLAVAEAMLELSKSVGFPTRLSEVDGFNNSYIERALTAAKNPQLSMKLQNMPVPLTADMIDEYMGPILEAARDGDFSGIKNVS